MDIKAQLHNLRTAPRKSRQVVDMIRNKNVAQARAILEFAVKRSSEPVLRLLNSAVASAVNDFKLDESNLRISKVTVDEGPKLKRSFPMSRGRAYPIMKRTSHITLIVSEIKATATEAKKEKKTESVVAKTNDAKVTKKKTVKKATK